MNKGNTSASSPRGSQPAGKSKLTEKVYDRKPRLTDAQRQRLRAAAARGLRPEDVEEIPEIPPHRRREIFPNYANPARKQQLTIRLDADVLAWLRSLGQGYHTKINSLLRSAMERSRPRA